MVKPVETSSRAGASAETARRIAEAAVAVVARDGFDALSVRLVAREAGVSGGAVQHHYATRAALLLAAFGHTVGTMSDRLTAMGHEGTVKETLRRLCAQALPLDEERRREAIVWTTLSSAAASHPDLAVAHRRGLELFTSLVASIIEAGREHGEVPMSVSPGAAATVLVAVVDGLSLQGIIEPAADRAADRAADLLGVLGHAVDALLR